MNFPFTEVDFGGDDPSAPIIQPSNGASQPRAPSKTKKNALDTSQVTNSKVSFFKNNQFLTKLYNFWVLFLSKIEHFLNKMDLYWSWSNPWQFKRSWILSVFCLMTKKEKWAMTTFEWVPGGDILKFIWNTTNATKQRPFYPLSKLYCALPDEMMAQVGWSWSWHTHIKPRSVATHGA